MPTDAAYKAYHDKLWPSASDLARTGPCCVLARKIAVSAGNRYDQAKHAGTVTHIASHLSEYERSWIRAVIYARRRGIGHWILRDPTLARMPDDVANDYAALRAMSEIAKIAETRNWCRRWMRIAMEHHMRL